MPAVLVIAIDGPAGSGKSTLARALADALDLPYVNTGSMYRAVTAQALEEGVSVDDAAGLARIARTLTFDLDRTSRPPSLTIDGRLADTELASAQVESTVSRVSRHPEVRAVLRDEQRRLGESGAVLEGRDIGSVVFPDATVKVFLEAEPGVRASRRADERESSPADRVAEELETRDRRDSRVTPLEPPADAVVVDTTSLSAAEVLELVLEVVRSRTGTWRT